MMKITTAKEVWISYPWDHRMFHIDMLALGFFQNIIISNEEWSSQLWTRFMQLHKKPEKTIQDFNGIWIRDLTIPGRRSNQLSKLWSYGCWELGNYVFVCSRERDECDKCMSNYISYSHTFVTILLFAIWHWMKILIWYQDTLKWPGSFLKN